jgi:hypothetical protein
VQKTSGSTINFRILKSPDFAQSRVPQLKQVLAVSRKQLMTIDHVHLTSRDFYMPWKIYLE